ncbi:MAG: xylulokinase [Agathobacter sp.]|nr:xylulokinase [Agathobacter sp.]
MYYIGIDLGTSAVKLLLMQEDGTVKNIVSKEYPIYFPNPGWSEQNPCDWWKMTIEGIKELTDGFDKDSIKGISFGGQMHGLVILDKDDNVIRPAILWNDGRTEKETDCLNNVIGKDKLSEYTGNIAFAGFTAPKILWLKENEPENFAKISKIMLPKDYIAYKMTGVHATDHSDASGMLLLDVKNKCWSKEMLDICGISSDVMPQIYESYEKIGTLTSEVSSLLGINKDCIVAAGAADNAAAAVGTGTTGDGKCNLSLGTSGTLFISSDEFMVDDNNALHSFVHANGRFHLMGCMLSAASCNNWWMKDILKTTDFPKEQEPLIQKDCRNELGNNNVFFLPYLMGERSPHNDASARGAFIGMSMDTKREDMLQAVFEGVAYGLRDSMEVARKLGINVTNATICGGGAKSTLWRKIVANVLNINVNTVMVEEGPAYGGAILASVAAGEYNSVEEATSKIIKIKEQVSPDEILVERYNKGYEKFKKYYPALKGLFV